jgi:hypothetical protein
MAPNRASESDLADRHRARGSSLDAQRISDPIGWESGRNANRCMAGREAQRSFESCVATSQDELHCSMMFNFLGISHY